MAIAGTTQAEAAHSRIQEAYFSVGQPVFSAAEYALIKTFIDHKAFDAIPDEGEISVHELAEKIGATDELIERITTFFIAGQVLQSSKPGYFGHTERSRLYKYDSPAAWLYIHMFNNVFRSFAQLPNFFAKHGLSSPKSASVTPLGWSHGYEDKPAYEILVENKVVHKGFNEALRELGVMYSLRGVYDFTWMKTGLAADSSRPAIVDIGGSHGLAIRDAVQNNSFIPAERCALFDLPNVVANTKETVAKSPDENMKKMQLVGGSMFEEFPKEVQGSMVYIIRRVLNDFPDVDVTRTFRNLRKFVAPDSRVLIIEEMLSEKRMSMNVCLDICLMMAAGKRRNAAMFSKLAEPEGFRLNAEFDSVNSKFDDFSVLEFVVV